MDDTTQREAISLDKIGAVLDEEGYPVASTQPS